MLKYDLVSVCGLVVVVGLLFAATGETAGRALCRFRGEPLFIAGGDTNVGIAPKGESRTVPVTVENPLKLTSTWSAVRRLVLAWQLPTCHSSCPLMVRQRYM